MRKSIIAPGGQDAPTPGDGWLDLERLARVEVTSEDPRYPIEAAFVPGWRPGWRADSSGLQIVRLRFDEPQTVHRIWLHFAEPALVRTQEFVLRWGTADGQPLREVVRQQWVFSPRGSTHETEDYRVDLRDVTVLELAISPDISGGDAEACRASLVEMRVAYRAAGALDPVPHSFRPFARLLSRDPERSRMCFSAEASAGVSAALLPIGGYCLATAWRKDRAYLPLALVPLLFGLQQLCEARVWDGLDRGSPELARVPALVFLFFALALWPMWVPLTAAAIEPPGHKRLVLFALAGSGLVFGALYYPPAVSGNGLSPAVVGHSIRYDFSAVPVTRSDGWWAGPALYLAVVCVPPLISRNRLLRPLGIVIVLFAALAYALFVYSFVSVWCFFAAVLALYLAYVLHRLPEPASPSSGGKS